MRTPWTVTIVVSCFIAFALSSSAREQKRSANANAYPYGTTTCLEGDKGPGLQLFLKQYSRCEGEVSYPYLEVDIREQPISVHQRIGIGAKNWAYRCRSPKESCEQALSGIVVFDHFEETSGSRLKLMATTNLSSTPAGLRAASSRWNAWHLAGSRVLPVVTSPFHSSSDQFQKPQMQAESKEVEI